MAKSNRTMPELPLVGQISDYLDKGAPKEIRKTIEKARKDDILDPGYPYREEMDKDDYEMCLQEHGHAGALLERADQSVIARY